MSTRTLMTVEEFAQMIPAESEGFELLEGELIPLSSGNPIHSEICSLMIQLLRNYFDQVRIGRALIEMDCRITDSTVFRPDISIFVGDRLNQIDRRKVPLPFAPDIAVEVLSPSEGFMDVNRKVSAYLQAGSCEVWLLDYGSVEILIKTNSGVRLLRGQDVLESPLLPGFTVIVSKLLAGF